MPFYIEVSANGVNIGKSQILSVPVAEVAKRLKPIDKSLIVGTWWNSKYDPDYWAYYSFNDDGTGVYAQKKYDEIYSFTYELDGNDIHIYWTNECRSLHFYNNNLYEIGGMGFKWEK